MRMVFARASAGAEISIAPAAFVVPTATDSPVAVMIDTVAPSIIARVRRQLVPAGRPVDDKYAEGDQRDD